MQMPVSLMCSQLSRRDALQQSVRNVSSRSFQLCDRAVKIDRIPV
jgi:hypothetical protein